MSKLEGLEAILALDITGRHAQPSGTGPKLAKSKGIKLRQVCHVVCVSDMDSSSNTVCSIVHIYTVFIQRCGRWQCSLQIQQIAHITQAHAYSTCSSKSAS